jgi:hypothetical protein
MEVSGQRHGQAALPPGENSGIHWRREWVGPRAGPDVSGDEKISCPDRIRTPVLPARSLVAIAHTVYRPHLAEILMGKKYFLGKSTLCLFLYWPFINAF